jgi:drug/metabolite transporter (DMT)-like permease
MIVWDDTRRRRRSAVTASPVLLALASALCYGTGDFLGGEGSRRSSPAQLSLLVQSTGLVAAVTAVAITAHGSPPTAVIEWGALSGVGSAIGNQALYRGLASGAMNVVAPLSAVLTAVLPAIVGLAGGDRLSLPGWAGLVLAVPAIGLVSLAPTPSSNHPAQARTSGRVRFGVGWGLLAGCGFGLLFVGLDKAGTTSGAWPLLSGQIVAVLLVGTITTYLRRRSPSSTRRSTPWSGALVWGVASGLGGAGGNIFFFAATGAGSLTVVAVLSALYPAITVLLAAIVLHERTSRIQLIGLLTCAVSVALITST